jgi:hypothetical protein
MSNKFRGMVTATTFGGTTKTAGCEHEHRTPEQAALCVQSGGLRRGIPNTRDGVSRVHFVKIQAWVAVQDPDGSWVDWAVLNGLTH